MICLRKFLRNFYHKCLFSDKIKKKGIHEDNLELINYLNYFKKRKEKPQARSIGDGGGGDQWLSSFFSILKYLFYK